MNIVWLRGTRAGASQLEAGLALVLRGVDREINLIDLDPSVEPSTSCWTHANVQLDEGLPEMPVGVIWSIRDAGEVGFVEIGVHASLRCPDCGADGRCPHFVFAVGNSPKELRVWDYATDGTAIQFRRVPIGKKFAQQIWKTRQDDFSDPGD